jgi:short-subunit dehydrogenase
MPPDTSRSTALITGASSGIGLALARQFANAGYQLVLVARDAARLDASALELGMQVSVPIIVIAKDLAQPGACAELAEELENRDIPITVLVNNAGVGIYGEFAGCDPAAASALIALNISAVTTLTRLLLPAMAARRHGRILNVASTAAFQPGPLMAVYFASKAYVLSFSEAIQAELAGSGVTVTCLCPGPTATGFADRARMGSSKLFQRGVMDSESVAAAGFRACIAGRSLVVPGLLNKLQVASLRLAPRWLVPRVVRALLASSAG